MIFVQASVTGNGTNAMTIMSTSAPNKPLSGYIVDVEVSGGTDPSMDVTITDPEGTVFADTGIDSQTGAKYKIDNAAIVRNSVSGPLSVTTANLTGDADIKVWIRPTHAKGAH